MGTRPTHPGMNELQRQVEGLKKFVAVQGTMIDYLYRVAGVSAQGDAIKVAAGLRSQADIENPAQPVPNPPSEQAAETTEEAVTPEAYDSPLAPGQTPGSVQQLPADTTGTPMDPGVTLPTAPYNQLQDVTAPVAGTETQRPLPETRTEVDVRVGDPMNPQRAFPWTLGPDAQGGQATAARETAEPAEGTPPAAPSDGRTMASIHLARLRIQTRTASHGEDDLAEATAIQTDASISDDDISKEIEILSRTLTANSGSQQVPASLVPRAASGVRRTTPSLAAGQAEALPAVEASVVDADTQDADLFD